MIRANEPDDRGPKNQFMDQALFEFIHYDLANPVMDAILPVYREKTTWKLAASVIKPLVGRPRPCAASDLVRDLVNCGGVNSFPSNHATNHFAVATFLSLTWLKQAGKGWRVALYVWAGSIALAQVYVGKHYPGDILAGALLGSLLAWGGAVLYRRLARHHVIPAAPKKSEIAGAAGEK